MHSMSLLRRALVVAPRVTRAQTVRSMEARSSARSCVVYSRRFASNSAPPAGAKGPEQKKVTSQMLVHEGKEILKLLIGGVVVVTALVASSGFVIETMKTVNPKPAPGRFVELRDPEGNPVNLHYQYFGKGDVTVIFDGGVGETSFDWDKIAQEVAPFARVLSIDRPGLGFSTPSQSTRTAEQAASEFQEVLSKLNIRGNVVLVGHGAGGYNMRQLAENLRHEVGSQVECKGLVLVDALQENLRADLESVSEPVREALQTMQSNGDTVLMLSRIGLIRLINNVQRKKNEAKYSAAALPYVEFYLPTPVHRKAANDENRALPLTEQRFREAASTTRGFEFPCVVLSHSKDDMFTSMKLQKGVDARAIVALEQKWQSAQRMLAKTVGATPATQIVVPDAGHFIHHEKPDEITKVVRALVNEAAEEDSVDGLAGIREGSCPI